MRNKQGEWSLNAGHLHVGRVTLLSLPDSRSSSISPHSIIWYLTGLFIFCKLGNIGELCLCLWVISYNATDRMVHGFSICKLTYLLNVWVDLRINIHCAFLVIYRFGQSVNNIWATYGLIPRDLTWRHSVFISTYRESFRIFSVFFSFCICGFSIGGFLVKIGPRCHADVLMKMGGVGVGENMNGVKFCLGVNYCTFGHGFNVYESATYIKQDACKQKHT